MHLFTIQTSQDRHFIIDGDTKTVRNNILFAAHISGDVYQHIVWSKLYPNRKNSYYTFPEIMLTHLPICGATAVKKMKPASMTDAKMFHYLDCGKHLPPDLKQWLKDNRCIVLDHTRGKAGPGNGDQDPDFLSANLTKEF